MGPNTGAIHTEMVLELTREEGDDYVGRIARLKMAQHRSHEAIILVPRPRGIIHNANRIPLVNEIAEFRVALAKLLTRKASHRTATKESRSLWLYNAIPFNCRRASRKRATARFAVALEAHELRWLP